jgi:hypothetical protein
MGWNKKPRRKSGEGARFERSGIQCVSRPEPAQSKHRWGLKGPGRKRTAKRQQRARVESGTSNAGTSKTRRHEQEKTISRLTAPSLAAPFFSFSSFAGIVRKCERPVGARAVQRQDAV